MPKTPMDYSKTIIYKIVCNDLSVTDLYVGHTTNWRQRKASHKLSIENINRPEYNLKKCKIIRENGGWCNWSMIQIEIYPCNDVHEACARERYWYETLGATLNSNVPNRSNKEHYEQNKEQIKEKTKDYYENNKEHILQQKKEYGLKNREQISLKRAEKYECECGAITTIHHKIRHFKTLKHCQFLETNNI